MRLLPRITALFLLALWLPATGHCALEAAGVITTSCHDEGQSGDQACASDGCASLESAHYRASSHPVQVAPPAVHEGLCLIGLALAVSVTVPTSDLSGPTLDRPQDWVSTWHFVRRTAPPSRAPTAQFA